MNFPRVITAVIVILTVIVVLRWPRIAPDIVKVTHSEIGSDHFVVEYRMSRPFALKLDHMVRGSEPAASGRGHWVRAGLLNPTKSEAVAVMNSRRTLIRGEHAVRLRVDRGPSLKISHWGQEVEVHPWLEEDASKAQWNVPSDTAGFGDGAGDSIVYFHTSSEQIEFLMVQVGTDLRVPTQK